MCKEHFGVALALKVPIFFVVTKIDLAPAHILKQTHQAICDILKKPGVRKKPLTIRSTQVVYDTGCTAYGGASNSMACLA